MMNVRAFSLAGFGGGLVSLGLLLAGCGGAAPAPGGPDTGGADEGLSISFNEDPGSKLIASAKAADGSELAIYGEKDADGQFTTISQIDVTGDDGGDVISVQLDENQRPVRMEADNEANATFTYDDDAGTVRVEAQDDTGATAVDESFDVLAPEDAGKPRPNKVAAKPSQDSLCNALSAVRDVMEEFFDCDASSSSALCTEAHARVPGLLKKLCETELREVSDLPTALGANPRDIPLGIRAHFTTRGAADGGTTVVLIAVAFGGVHPYESISWSLLAGPGEAGIDDLPSGVALVDLLIPGRYTFRAAVTDAQGQEASVDIEVALDELPGLVIRYSPEFPELGQVVEFSAADTTSPSDDPIKFFHWRFGDGQANTGVNVTHAYTEEGEFIVSLLISTESGRRATVSALVRVGTRLDCEDDCQLEAEAAFFDCMMAGGFEAECASRSGDVLEECFRERCDGVFDCAEHCDDYADFVFDECLDDGNSDEECDSLATDAFTDCLREQCEQPVECERACHDQAEDIYFDCRENGKPEQECAGLSRTFLENCLNRECERPPNCGERCERRAGRVFDECRRNGGNEEECAHRAREHAERCRSEECFDSGDCDELCRDHAERVRMECLEDGGTEDHCNARADEFFDLCIQEQCERPEDCERLCTEEADWWFQRCVEDGGSDEECADLVDDFRDICFREECTDQPDCGFLCYEGATRFFAECLFDGRPEEECLEEAELRLDDCLGEECEGQEFECEESCWDDSDEVFDRCLIGGGDEEDCETQAQRFVDACLFENCDQAPGCVQQCEDRAQAAFDACLNDGRPEDECSNESFEVFDRCLFEECDQDELPDCERFCDQQAGWKFDECMAAGNPEDECIRLARDLFNRCLQEECGREGEPDCVGFCAEHADSVFDNCLFQGGTDAECAGIADEAFDGCVVHECGELPPPPPDDCEAFCDLQARRVFEECMFSGGTEVECVDRSESIFQICVTQECLDDPPPPTTEGCEQFCLEQAELAFDECLATGGTDVECNILWDEVFSNCVVGECGDEQLPPVDCEQVCVDEANVVFDNCLTDGGTDFDCDVLADDHFSFCVDDLCTDATPPPPPNDCDSICLARADRAFDDCVLDAADVDCDLVWEETFNLCLTEECN